MPGPSVSVGLPVTKIEYLKEAVSSLNDQTYSDFELIVLNNGADERIRKKIKSIVTETNKRNNIRYYENEVQLPVIENWNKCLGYAQAELFILFSDDDIYLPDFIKELVLLAERYPDCNLFHCRVLRIDNNGEPTYLTEICPPHEVLMDFMWHRLKGFRSLFIPDFMCRTKSLREIGGFQDLPLAWGADDITWFMIAKNGGVAYTPKTLCYWRLSGINISSIGNIHSRLSSLNIYISKSRSILSDFKPAGIEEKFLLDDIHKQLMIWKRKEQVQLFRQYRRGHSFLNTIKLLITYKHKKEIESKNFMKILFNSALSIFKSGPDK